MAHSGDVQVRPVLRRNFVNSTRFLSHRESDMAVTVSVTCAAIMSLYNGRGSG
jgi:hypothetical protein